MERQTYYKIECSGEWEATGTGLGYDELFGDVQRYYWVRSHAEATANSLTATCAPECGYVYTVSERTAYEDGKYDDDDDNYAAEQLELPVIS